jgi:hypothetical protein
VPYITRYPSGPVRGLSVEYQNRESRTFFTDSLGTIADAYVRCDREIRAAYRLDRESDK